MALLDRGDRAFHNSVERSGFHYKSTRLKKLLKALEQAQNNPTQVPMLEYLFRRLCRWRETELKEFATRGSLAAALEAEIRVKYTGLVPPPPPTAAEAMVARVLPELNAFKQYACGDAFMNTPRMIPGDKTSPWDYSRGFASCHNPSKRAEISLRSESLKGTARGAATPFDTAVSPGQWKAPSYKMIYDRVTSETAGICVTFGKAAAHLLTSGVSYGPRVEIVSYANHVYVLVNRQGAVDENGVIDSNWVNEADVIIVDPWAASIGWECVYYGIGQYPLGGMVNPLIQVAEWVEKIPGDPDPDA